MGAGRACGIASAHARRLSARATANSGVIDVDALHHGVRSRTIAPSADAAFVMRHGGSTIVIDDCEIGPSHAVFCFNALAAAAV